MWQEVLWSTGRLGDYQGIDVSFQRKFEADSCVKSVVACSRLSHPRRSYMAVERFESNCRNEVHGGAKSERGIRGTRCHEGIAVNASVQLEVEVETSGMTRLLRGGDQFQSDSLRNGIRSE
jgi:hypothetical protein